MTVNLNGQSRQPESTPRSLVTRASGQGGRHIQWLRLAWRLPPLHGRRLPSGPAWIAAWPRAAGEGGSVAHGRAWTEDRLTTGESQEAAIRRIGTADLRQALRQGWDDFLAIPTQLVFLCVLYPIVGLVAARAFSGGDLLPLLWPLVAGLSLVGPVAAVGLYEISRRREAGEEVSWLTAFAVLRHPNLPQIAMLGIMLMAIFVAWVAVAKTDLERDARPPAGDGVRRAWCTPPSPRRRASACCCSAMAPASSSPCSCWC